MPKSPGGYEPSAAELKAQRDAAMKTRATQGDMLNEMANQTNRNTLNDKETSVLKSKLETKLNKSGSNRPTINGEEDGSSYFGTGIKIRNYKTGS